MGRKASLMREGFASGSSWSRGQAWALYGFTLSYLHTGKQEYLDTAKRVANYFISQITEDYIPRCDFRQPKEPELKDNAAGNIAACGLLELCQAVPEAEAAPYYAAALRILKAQEERCADWSPDTPAIFTQCTAAYHDLPGRHMTMQYGDYYFIEAICRLRGGKLLIMSLACVGIGFINMTGVPCKPIATAMLLLLGLSPVAALTLTLVLGAINPMSGGVAIVRGGLYNRKMVLAAMTAGSVASILGVVLAISMNQLLLNILLLIVMLIAVICIFKN